MQPNQHSSSQVSLFTYAYKLPIQLHTLKYTDVYFRANFRVFDF